MWVNNKQYMGENQTIFFKQKIYGEQTPINLEKFKVLMNIPQSIIMNILISLLKY